MTRRRRSNSSSDKARERSGGRDPRAYLCRIASPSMPVAAPIDRPRLPRQNGPFMRSGSLAAWAAALALALATTALAQDPGFVLQGEGGLVTALVLDPSAPVHDLRGHGARPLQERRRRHDLAPGRKRPAEAIPCSGSRSTRRQPSRLYATTDTGGVYRSADAGETGPRPARASAPATSEPSRWIPTTREPCTPARSRECIFKSTDAGATWTEPGPPIARVTVSTIAFDPVVPDTLYVGTNSEGGPDDRRRRPDVDAAPRAA